MLIPATPSPLFIRWFQGYTRRYLQRSFHAVHLLGEWCSDPQDNLPILLCTNHSSWWDVMLGFHLSTQAFTRPQYGMMDARQLMRYRLFTRLGMIGVDRESLSGIKESLQYVTQTVGNQRGALWLTPQGEMVSNAIRPVRFQPGLSHLVASLSPVYLATITLHYEFWDEPLPEAFVSFSALLRVDAGLPGFHKKSFLRHQEQCMERQLDALLAAARMRDRSQFTTLLAGKTGVSATYDAIRSLAARMRGESYTSEHAGVSSPRWKPKSKR